MEPSWQPDPTGRHHYRWWDGAAWTDAVADQGVTSTDPVSAPATRVTSITTTPTLTVSTAPRGGPAAGGPVYATEPIKVGGGIGKWVALAVILLAGIGVALYLLVFRGDATVETSSEGVTTGTLGGPGSYVFRDIKMTDGDAIRYRVEGDPDRDLVTYLLAPDQLASDHASQYFTDYGTDVGLSDAEDLISDFTDANDVLTEGDVQDAVIGYLVLRDSDRCCAGVPDTDTFVATVSGTYRIVVVEADDRESDVTIIVQRFDRQLYAYAEITDSLRDDPFFTDTGFFRDSEPFEPDSGS